MHVMLTKHFKLPIPEKIAIMLRKHLQYICNTIDNSIAIIPSTNKQRQNDNLRLIKHSFIWSWHFLLNLILLGLMLRTGFLFPLHLYFKTFVAEPRRISMCLNFFFMRQLLHFVLLEPALHIIISIWSHPMGTKRYIHVYVHVVHV